MALTLFVVVAKLGVGSFAINNSLTIKLLFAFLIWGSFAHIFDNGSTVLFRLREYASVYYSLFMFFVLTLLTNESKSRMLLNAILIAAGCSILLIFVRYYLGLGGMTTTDGVYRYGNYEFVGIVILFSYLFSGMLLGVKRNNILLLIGILIILFVVNFLIAHRSASLALILSSVIVMWLLGRKYRTLNRGILIVLSLLLGTTLLVLLSPDFAEGALSRITGIFDSAIMEDKNASWRLEVWMHALSHMDALDYLIGVGWGYYIKPLYFSGRDYSVDGFIGIHNSILYYFLHIGFIGVTIFLSLVLTVYRRALRAINITNSIWRKQTLTSLLAGNAGILFFALFNVVLEGPYMSVLFWTSLGLLFNISRHVVFEQRQILAGNLR